MSNSKLYQPPPPPPKKVEAPVDPLLALSKAPTMIAPAAAEELTDLTDDEALEQWAQSGTKVMPKVQKSTPPPPSSELVAPVVPTMVSAPLPSFYPMAYSTPPRIQEKRTSAAIWVVPLALFIFAGGVVAAAAGWYVYHTSDAASASTADTSSNVTVTSAPTETAPPAVTLTATTTTTIATTASPTPTTTATMVVTSTSTRRSSPTTNATSTPAATTNTNGAIRTFAAGNGKPVYVDGKQVGYGGGKITTACGHHTVSVGTGHAKTVDIPCNGPTLTVGTPDGT